MNQIMLDLETMGTSADAASGSRQKPVVKTACSCGQEMLIEHGAKRTCRADGKRIFYSLEDDDGLCAFRCRNCLMPVSETVPGAEYVVTTAL